MAIKKTKTFDVGACIKVWAGLTLEANSLEDAVAQSKNLEVSDFIKFLGEHTDSNIKIIQVYDPSFNIDTDD